MIPGLEMLACQDLAVPMEIMEHVVRVESSFNPYAIGVVGTRLARQPANLEEAVATASRLERDGYNFSLGLAQVNRHNLAAQGLSSYELAFSACPNLAAGARILADCHVRAGGNWDKAFSCYYSGNFSRGFRDGYVDRIRHSMATAGRKLLGAIPVAGSPERPGKSRGRADLVSRRAAVATPAAAMSDAPAGTTRIPVPAQARDAVGVAVVGSGIVDPPPFVPWVSAPTAAPPQPSPPLPPEAPGRDGDSAFVF